MKTAPRHPSPNGLVERSVRIFKDAMKKWAHRGGSRIFFRRGCTHILLYFNTNKPHSSFFFCRIPVVLENRRSSQGGVRTPCTLPLDPPLAHGRLRVSYLFVRWIAPVTRTLQLFHATTLILNSIISTSLTNSFPARANTWMLQKSRDSSRHFRVSQLVKSCTSLTSSSIKQCGVSLWLSQVEIFLPNEQASETGLTRYSNKITSSFEKCSSLRNTTVLRKTITRGKFLLM